MGKLPLTLCGLGLVYSMAQVYRLRSVPAWDTNRTLLAFLVSVALLGGIGIDILNNFEKADFMPFTNLVLGAGLIVALGLSLANQDQTHQTSRSFRLSLIGLGLVGVLGIYVVSNAVGRWLVVPIFVMVVIEEVIGRWLFYEQIHQRIF